MPLKRRIEIRMNKLFSLLVLVLYACNNIVPQASEVGTSYSPIKNPTLSPNATSPAPSTQRQPTATWYLKTATPVLPTPPPDDIGYYEGIIIITQYYTFLGHGLYEEAYELLSSSRKERYPLEEYIENGKIWYKKVEILSIVPQHSRRDSMIKRRFIVSFIAWGEGKMTGAAMSGEVQTGYITLVKENGEWKMDEGGFCVLDKKL